MSLTKAARALRVCALAIWLGATVMAVIAVPLIYRNVDALRAGDVASGVLTVTVKAALLAGLAALAGEAVVFFARGTDAPAGWRRYVPAVCLMAALALAVAAVFKVEPQAYMASGPIKPGDAPVQIRLRVAASTGVMCLLGAQAVLSAAALIASVWPKKAESTQA
jgi:hypothetical protein